MDDEKSGSGSLSTSGLWLAMAVAAGAFFIHEVPLQGSRPVATDPKPYAYLAQQDVDARLWQDPLTAVARARQGLGTRDAAEKPPDATTPAAVTRPDLARDTLHGVAEFGRDIERRRRLPSAKSDSTTPRVVGVMVQGGSYAESVEARRRARYAVLAALKQANYTPEDAAHLGYVVPDAAVLADRHLPAFVAYEWFESGDQAPPILVLWLDEYAFARDTRERIRLLQAQMRIATLPFVVVGPAYSSTLHDMAVVASKPTEAGGPASPPMTFYAYGATSDDAEILKGTPLSPPGQSFVAPLASFDGPLHAAFHGTGQEVFRTITSDRQLVDALRTELALRGVDPGRNPNCSGDGLQHVVLIAEWDTLYGRTLPALMSDALQPADARCGPSAKSVHRYSYLRGLDGQLPAVEGAPSADDKQADKAGTGVRSVDRSDLRRQIERPDGQGQLDYLRRMTADLQSLDRGWRRHGGSIVAVGVLGSDVFDKMLILQALRAEFPGAIFFTTDLDARMLHPVEQAWARNALVASGFGLQLRPELQADIPPFRDNYQTSVYFSTLLALSDVGRADPSPTRFAQAQIDRGLDGARVFEIGRLAAFDYSPSNGGRGCDGVSPCAGASASNPSTRGPGADRTEWPSCAATPATALDRALCDGIHPTRSPMSPSSGPARFYKELLLLVLAGLFVFGTYRTVRQRTHDASARTRSTTRADNGDPSPGDAQAEITFADWLAHRRAGLIAAGVGLAILIVYWLGAAPLYRGFSAWVLERGNGEPINFVEGISIWPTELIRAFAVIFSVGFIAIAWRKLDDNLEHISEDFRFEPVLHDMVRIAKTHYAQWPIWKRLVWMFSFRLRETGGGVRRVHGLTWSAQRFWEKYLYQGLFLSRCARVVLCIVLFWAIGSWIMSRFGFPNTPYRGTVSRSINGVMLGLSVSAMMAVLFFVVDALVFCVQLIRALQRDVLGEPSELHETVPSRWAQSTRDYYADEFATKGQRLDALILLDFIAARTKVVASLVYYPFVVIALMVLARNNIIDHWTMPAGLLFIYVASVVLILFCAVRLRMAAEAARDRVLEVLGNDLVRQRRDGGEDASQIEAMIARVRRLQTGAFAPYSQQPFLRATLLPLTTLGGPALLELLSASF